MGGLKMSEQQYDAHVQVWREMEADREIDRQLQRKENAYYENEYYWRY